MSSALPRGLTHSLPWSYTPVYSVLPPQTVSAMASLQLWPYFALFCLELYCRLRSDGGTGWAYDTRPQGEACRACCPPSPTPQDFPWDSGARRAYLVEDEPTVSLNQGVSPQPPLVQFCEQTHWQRHASRWLWEPGYKGTGYLMPSRYGLRLGYRETRQEAILGKILVTVSLHVSQGLVWQAPVSTLSGPLALFFPSGNTNQNSWVPRNCRMEA